MTSELESSVQYYARLFPVQFTRAKGAFLWDMEGRRYTDFFAGAGTINYGHNPDHIIDAVIGYLRDDGIVHSLDMNTRARTEFMDAFNRTILEPRGLSYRFLFPGPAGANAVEAALKLARKASGRSRIAYFSGAFHGMSLGALSVSDAAFARQGAGVSLPDTVRLPFDTGGAEAIDELQAAWAEHFGQEPPAGVIVESFQCDGGMRAASAPWLRALQRLCQQSDVPLIVDDIQAGNGRTGTFFSFERADIVPDIVCLSKSLGGAGFPLSLVLVSDHFDSLGAGQHTGTFRGFNLSFVAGMAALSSWRGNSFEESIAAKGQIVDEVLQRIADARPDAYSGYRGYGLAHGLICKSGDFARMLSAKLFDAGIIAETCGPSGSVLKTMPPLTIEEEVLQEALGTLERVSTAL